MFFGSVDVRCRSFQSRETDDPLAQADPACLLRHAAQSTISRRLRNTIFGVPPLVYVLPVVINCGGTKARVLIGLFVVWIFVIPITIPARSIEGIVIRLGRAVLADMLISQIPVAVEFAYHRREELYLKREVQTTRRIQVSLRCGDECASGISE